MSNNEEDNIDVVGNNEESKQKKPRAAAIHFSEELKSLLLTYVIQIGAHLSNR